MNHLNRSSEGKRTKPFKKLLAGVLAVAMVLSMGTVAFASETEQSHGTIKLTSSQDNGTDINLAVGETATITVTPYLHAQYTGCMMDGCPERCEQYSQYVGTCFYPGLGCACDKTPILRTTDVEISNTNSDVASTSSVTAVKTISSADLGSTADGTFTIEGLSAGTTKINVSTSLEMWEEGTATFNVTVSDSAADDKSGSCGENATYSLSDEGVLTISGTGAMNSYSASDAAPWAEYTDSITSVVIESGITSVGDYAFSGCSKVSSVELAEVISIGSHAFDGCSSLTAITISKEVAEIGAAAFDNCSDLVISGYSSTAAETYANENGIVFSVLFGIVNQPVSSSVLLGKTTQFTVGASGSGLTYQWYYKAVGSTKWKKTSVKGYKTSTITVDATTDRDGVGYRCEVSDSAGNTVTSDEVYLSVEQPDIQITEQPTSVSVYEGKTVELSVGAESENYDSLTFKWYYKASGSSSWKKTSVKGYSTDTIRFSLTAARNGYSYRCEISGGAGESVISDEATVTILSNQLSIKTQPTSVTSAVGSKVTFSVEAASTVESDTLSYQWYYKKVGGSWAKTSLKGNRTATLQVGATAARNGYSYKCVVADTAGNTVTSNDATLTVS